MPTDPQTERLEKMADRLIVLYEAQLVETTLDPKGVLVAAQSLNRLISVKRAVLELHIEQGAAGIRELDRESKLLRDTVRMIIARGRADRAGQTDPNADYPFEPVNYRTSAGEDDEEEDDDEPFDDDEE